MQHHYTLLALGDSYTIGENLPLHKSFPYQTVCLLRKAGYYVMPPEIIAKTGWTSDELDAATKDFLFLPKYDFVTLLIGVNNQYRGRDIIEYKEQFEGLLKKSIGYANGKPEHVIVLSIPDYSVTPYAATKNPEKISKEIDEFNAVNRSITEKYGVTYFYITDISRKGFEDPTLVATDGLHPSGKMYAIWTDLILKGLKF